MTARQINQVLWSATICVAAVAAAVVVAGVVLPVRPDNEPEAGHIRANRTNSSSGVASLPPLNSFDALWAKPLRQSLTDAPRVAAQPANATPAAMNGIAGLPVTVAGTIGTSLAMLRISDGSVVLKSVGERVNGADVLAIRPGEVDVRFNGRSVTLAKPKEPAGSVPTTNPNDQ